MVKAISFVGWSLVVVSLGFPVMISVDDRYETYPVACLLIGFGLLMCGIGLVGYSVVKNVRTRRKDTPPSGPEPEWDAKNSIL